MSPLLTSLSIALGSVIGTTLYVFTKFMLGSFFFYKLMLEFKLRPVSAFVGSTIFSYGSYATANLQGPVGTTYFLVPPFIYLIKKFIDEQSWQYSFWLPFIILWLFTAGYVPALAYIIMFTLFFIIFNYYSLRINKIFMIKILYVVVASAFILSPFLLDTARYLLYSVDLSYRAEKWNYGLDIGRSATFIFPWFYGEQGFLRKSTYFGLISIIFIYLGSITQATNRVLNSFKVYAIILSFILYSELFRTIFYQRVPLANLSDASNQLTIYGFVLAVIATFGVENLVRNKINLYKLLPIFVIIVTGGIYFISISEEKVNLRTIIRFLVIVFAAIMILVLVFFAQKTKYSKRIVGVLLAILFSVHILDLHSFARNYTWTVQSKYVYPETPLISFLKQNQGDSKIVAMGVNLIPDSYLWHSLRVVGGRGFFPHQVNRLYKDIDKNIENQPPTQKFFYSDLFDFESTLLRLMGVRYVVSSPEEGQQPGIDLISNSFVRKVYSAPDGVVYEFPNVKNPFTLFEKTNYLGQSFKLPVSELELMNSSKYEIKIHYSKNSAKKLTIKSEEETVLVVGDNFDRYWKATVNGMPVKIEKAAGYFMSVGLPRGENIIEFKYRPPSFYFAVLSFLIAMLNFTALLISMIVKKKSV